MTLLSLLKLLTTLSPPPMELMYVGVRMVAARLNPASRGS